jgi:hypothetical protein
MLDFNVARVAALVTAASLENAQRAFDTLNRAFASDSPSGWMFPDEQQYLQYFPILAKAFGGAPISPDCSGVALWLSSVAGPDQDALAGLIEEGVTKQRKGDLLAVFDEMARLHPTESHRYLPLIEVEPRRQGQGRPGEPVDKPKQATLYWASGMAKLEHRLRALAKFSATYMLP